MPTPATHLKVMNKEYAAAVVYSLRVAVQLKVLVLFHPLPPWRADEWASGAFPSSPSSLAGTRRLWTGSAAAASMLTFLNHRALARRRIPACLNLPLVEMRGHFLHHQRNMFKAVLGPPLVIFKVLRTCSWFGLGNRRMAVGLCHSTTMLS